MIFPIDVNDFIKEWGCFGVASELFWDNFWHMKMTFGAFRGHFEGTLSISTSNFMCDACVVHTCTGLVEPNREAVKQLIFFCIFEEFKGTMGFDLALAIKL